MVFLQLRPTHRSSLAAPALSLQHWQRVPRSLLSYLSLDQSQALISILPLRSQWLTIITCRDVPGYIIAQLIGAFAGVALAHLMFGLPVFFVSHHNRSGVAQMLREFVATFGLLATIWGCLRYRPQAVPFAVAAFIMAGYWFTSSTSFANPAVTLARSVSNTFVGIRPIDAGVHSRATCRGCCGNVGVSLVWKE